MSDRKAAIESVYHVPCKEDHTDFGPIMDCLCGSSMFILGAWFDPDTREIGGYLLEGQCMQCGAAVRLPTPADQVFLDDEGEVRHL